MLIKNIYFLGFEKILNDLIGISYEQIALNAKLNTNKLCSIFT